MLRCCYSDGYFYCLEGARYGCSLAYVQHPWNWKNTLVQERRSTSKIERRCERESRERERQRDFNREENRSVESRWDLLRYTIAKMFTTLQTMKGPISKASSRGVLRTRRNLRRNSWRRVRVGVDFLLVLMPQQICTSNVVLNYTLRFLQSFSTFFSQTVAL